jgi:hypothetical protein
VGGWLLAVTRSAAVDAMRKEIATRRQAKVAAKPERVEAEAAAEAQWKEVAPLLDGALAALPAKDRDVVVLRVLENQSLNHVGRVLGISENAAGKRVERALGRLRKALAKREVAVSAAALAGVLTSRAVQAAPGAVVRSTLRVVATGTAGAEVLALVNAGMRALSVQTAKLVTAIAFLLLAATVTGMAFIGPVAAKEANASRAAGLENADANANGKAPATEQAAILKGTLREGLILHLSFDREEPGGGVTDLSGSGNNGQVIKAHWTPEGRFGGAYEFRDDTEMIQVPHHESLNAAQFTLAAWVKGIYSDGSWRRIIDKSHIDLANQGIVDQGYCLSIAGDWQQNNWRGKATMELGRVGGIRVSRNVVTDGEWHLVVTTYDGAENVLYVDGSRNASTRSNRAVPPCTRPLTIGSAGYDPPIGGNGSFLGVIDEPMIWDRVLTADEVVELSTAEGAKGSGIP